MGRRFRAKRAMSLYLLDTDTFSLYLRNHPGVVAAVNSHSAVEVALSVITIGELWDGWQAVARRAKSPEQTGAAYDRLTVTLNELRNWRAVSFSAAAIRRYADLKRRKLNVSANDLKNAAIALETESVMVTHNTVDFRRVTSLVVEDWAT